MASDRRNFFWTASHIFLGFVCTYTPYLLVVWFYLILFSNFGKSIRLLNTQRYVFYITLFSYLISFEILNRMAQTAPFIPYELGKYLLVAFGLFGILFNGMRSQRGIWMVFLITPAIFYDFSKLRPTFELTFNFFGPLALCLGIAFAYRLAVTQNSFNQILKLIFWGCLSSLVYTYIKTPDLDQIQFTLKAQFDTTAGHSSNQVATIFGLGMFLSFYSWYNSLKFSGYRILDVLLFLGFTFQGLLSFSRGGMLVGVAAIALLIFLPQIKMLSHKSHLKQKSHLSFVFGLLACLLLYGIFEVTNQITDGKLIQRYQGETEGTLSGYKERNANNISSGRIEIFQEDFELFKKYPLTGVGCGVSPYLRSRNDMTGGPIAPHIELSRILADHGFLGALYATILFVSMPIRVWQINEKSRARNLLFSLLIIALLTSFHAAMRTFVTPLFVILSVLKIVDE